MPETTPRNPFYLLLLLASFLFAVTAIAYAIIPTLEQQAVDAGPPTASAWRDALTRDGGWWLFYELAAMIIFGIASMVLDRLRSLKKEREDATIAGKSTDQLARLE
jgi:hypothetical protein